MRKVLLPILFFLLIAIPAKAQEPEELLTRLSDKFPIEKTYLHLDRDSYLAGETAWFKAYLYSDYQPDTISTALYVELLNESAEIVNRKILPVFLGSTNGQLELPDSLNSGAYLIRAYTATMLNHDPAFIYRRTIYIHGKKKNERTDVTIKEKMLRFEFFPEGGNLVAGLANIVAFKTTDENGLPVEVKGLVKNGKNETIASFSSYHDGMGLFEITPVSNEKYYVEADGINSPKKNYLPDPTDKGIAVTLIPHPQGNFFEIKQHKNDPDFRVAYMTGQMQHHIVFRQNFNPGKDELQGVINTKNLMSGILHITFFNKAGLPLAERLCFVNNKEYIQPAELISDTVNFSPREKNRFSIVMKDTVQGSFSVSVTDADYSFTERAEENMVSRFLLTADLKGYIHNPAYYFSADNDSVNTALDLLMMTNGWRRFKWTELGKMTASGESYKDPAYITLSGKASLRDVKKPFAEKRLVVFVSAGDSARNVQMINTDKLGRFRLDSLLFFGKARIMFSDTRGKQSQYIDVHPDTDSLSRTFSLPATESQFFNGIKKYAAADPARWKADYEALLKANGVMLEGITVKARKKSPLQEIDENYTHGAFSGDARKVFDLVNTDDGENYRSVYHFLEAKGFLPNSRNLPTISAMGEISTNIYLDEFPVDIDLELLPMNKVALIKIFTTFVGEWGNGPGGVIAIYTKKGENISAGALKSDIISYQGFSVVKEFYSPDYKVSPSKAPGADNRITLDWRPDIFINNINPRVPLSFYNNDRTKKYRIIVEGLTVTGKMVFIEKIISGPVKGF